MEKYSNEWWNQHITENGVSAKSASLSEWSSSRRFRTISKWVSPTDRVADVGGGVGNLGRLFGPFQKYLVSERSEAALSLCPSGTIRCHQEFSRDFQALLDRCVEEEIDWIVYCSVFVFPDFMGDWAVETVLRKSLASAKVGVIASFHDSRFTPRQEHLRPYTVNEVIDGISDLRPSLDCTAIPNEFFVILKRPDRDWVL